MLQEWWSNSMAEACEKRLLRVLDPIYDHPSCHAGFEILGDVVLAPPPETVWLLNSGEEPRDAPTFEIDRFSPIDTAPDDLITEVRMPLA